MWALVALAALALAVPLRDLAAQAGTAPPVGMAQGPVMQRPIPAKGLGGQASATPLTHLQPTGAQYAAAPTTAGGTPRPVTLPPKSPRLVP